MYEITSEIFDFVTREKVGEGAYRNVYNFFPDETLVLKVAKTGSGQRQNILENVIWDEVKERDIAKWFAPVVGISKGGKYLLQKKVEFGLKKDYPQMIPHFFLDLKYKNYGWLGNKFVCVDYAGTVITNGFTNRLEKAEWWE